MNGKGSVGGWGRSEGVPHDEVRVRLLHDEFLWTNVLLLSRVDDVPLLQDLHGVGFVLVALELNLQWGNERDVQARRRGRGGAAREVVTVDVRRPPTSSTRPNPPTPRVSMMLKSARLRLKKKAFSASYLWCRDETGERDGMGEGLERSWRMTEEIIHFQQPGTKYLCAHLFADLKRIYLIVI